ncbi:hypothetical protein FSP39_009363 [Pinctada imbricata]|uniref:Uncharacterized protein n=1 Tax=Pinctada imbricata TaxID=66713 RepID=A0AA88Y5N3_PINIB|nr:hypothetical protein FSP39_009363 [Pinctada imbricata]
MTAFISLTAFVSGIVIAYLFYSMKEFLFLNQNSNTRKDSFLLGIGVLSARENFEARQAIRDTWLSKQHSNDSYRGWFIIGNRSCDIHPENRVDEYGCERWKPEDQDSDVADLIDAYKISDGNLANSVNGPFNQQLVSEIYFKVMYPIRLKRLAIIEGLMSTTANNTYTVIVLNRRSQEKIATASFNDIDPGIKAGLFFHQAVENIMLEKGRSHGVFDVDAYKEGLDQELQLSGGTDTFWGDDLRGPKGLGGQYGNMLPIPLKEVPRENFEKNEANC